MLAFLPEGLQDILTIVAVIAGPSGIIWLILQNKQANRRLKVEEAGADVQSRVAEGSLTVEQFNAALPAYKDLLDRSNKDRDAAIAKMDEYKAEVDEIREKQDRLVKLFMQVVKRNNIQLTTEELRELEETKPRPRVRRLRPKES